MTISDDAARFGDPRIPAETITSQSHLFRLGEQPRSTRDGGWFQQANEDNFPILKGQEASLLLLTLEPGGIREPHSTSFSRPRGRSTTSRTAVPTI